LIAHAPRTSLLRLHHAKQLPPRAVHRHDQQPPPARLQPKTQESEGFTGSYDTVRLVYWESFDDVHKTFGREKQLKNWRREKKLWLIASTNPEFRDLAADWYKNESVNPRRA
jgi:predicted GIY-YIG superfamily endonuclease